MVSWAVGVAGTSGICNDVLLSKFSTALANTPGVRLKLRCDPKHGADLKYSYDKIIEHIAISFELHFISIALTFAAKLLYSLINDVF